MSFTKLIFTFIVFCVTKNKSENIDSLQNEDIYLNITQLIKKSSYSVEEYTVLSDGYVLKLFRIPGDGPVVFLMHGTACSADDWITPGERGVGFLLADQGFDVWMGNARGNKYSRQHTHLNPSNKEFWNFSFHEIGLYDLPVMIDLVLDKTKSNSLIYIGHSQGTTVFFILCSLRPEYNKKVKLMIALSAIAWFSNVKGHLLQLFAKNHVNVKFFLFSLGIYEIFADTPAYRAYQRNICGNIPIVCEQVLASISGYNAAQINFERLSVIYNHFPSVASVKQVDHYAQLILSGYFRQFDYHFLDNFKIYGSGTPPSYPVDRISARVAIFYSENDLVSALEDVKILVSKLSNVVYFEKVPDVNFNHFDYLFAKDLKDLLLPQILELIEKYN